MIKLSIQLNNLINTFLLVKVGSQREREKKANGYKTLYICKSACVSCSSIHSLIQPLSCFIFFLFSFRCCSNIRRLLSKNCLVSSCRLMCQLCCSMHITLIYSILHIIVHEQYDKTYFITI